MLIYLLIAFFATLIGSTAGMGGGVIIKPMLDILGDYNVVTISILSSITVLSMAIVATTNQVKNGFKITNSAISITIGAMLGGVLGGILFALVKASLPPNLITAIQSVILMILLTFCLFYQKLPQLNIRSLAIQVLVGLFLGLMSSFLGIGGGPINVAVLCVVLGICLRESAKISIFIIVFSQIAGLITKVLNGMFAMVEDYSMLIVMIPAAIIGGFIGSILNIKLSNKNISLLFKSAVTIVILLCVYNSIVSLQGSIA